MEVLFIAQGFPPLQASGSLRSGGFANALPAHGVSLRVVAGEAKERAGAVVEYTWKDHPDWEEVVRFDWGMARAWSRWEKQLLRIPLGSTWVRRRRSQTVASALIKRCARVLEASPISAIYVSVAPAEGLLAAVELRKRFGLPVIADLRDPWSYAPPIPYRHWLDFVLERRLERRVLQQCDMVVVPAERSAELLTRHLNVPRDRVEVVPNGYNEADFVDEESTDGMLESGKFHVVYTGEYSASKENATGLSAHFKNLFRGLGFLHDPLACDRSARSLNWFLKAVTELIEEDKSLAKEFRIHVVGAKKDKSDAAVERFSHPECIELHPRVPAKQAASMAGQADLLLLNQNHYSLAGEDFCVAIPAKVYTYLRSGSRILACVQPSETRDLVAEAKAGPCVDPRSVDEIKAALRDEIREWRAAGRQRRSRNEIGFDVGRFDRSQLAGTLADRLKQLMARSEANPSNRPDPIRSVAESPANP